MDFKPREKPQKPRDNVEEKKRVLWQRPNSERRINGEEMIFYEDFVKRTNEKWVFLYRQNDDHDFSFFFLVYTNFTFIFLGGPFI